MSGSGTIYTEQSVLGHTLGFAPMAFPAQVFVGLCSAAMPPSETVGGIEAFGGGYTRMLAQFALIDTPANIAANVASVEWPIATASWGTLGFFELWDAPAGGNRLYWGALIDTTSQLPTTITVSAGDIVRFSAGTLAVQAATGSGGTSSVGAYLPLAGGTLLGPLLLAADPTTYLQAATKQYVDAHSGSGGGPGFLPLSGGTMLGQLALAGNATAPLQAVPLQQIDTTNVVNVLNHGAKGDGTTDDTAAIQGALNTYAGKATVFVPDTGQSYICNTLSPPTGTDLLIHGSLKLAAAASNSLFNIVNANNVTIRGHGMLDGNGPAQTTVSPGIAVINTSNCVNLQISGVTLKNAHLWNLNVGGSTHVRVDRVTMTGGNNANEFASGCDDCWLTNCSVDGTNNGDYGFCFYGGVTNSGAIGNTIKNAGAGTTASPPGIGILSDGSQAPCSNIVIADNIIHGSGGPGISCNNVAGGLQTRIIIANNSNYQSNQIGTGNGAAVSIDNTSDVTIIGNQISANGHSGLSATGIFLGPNASNVSITGNQIFDIGQGTTTGIGVWNDGGAYVHMSGNYIYDDQTTPTMQYSVTGQTGVHSAYIGNFFDRPYNLGAVADTVAANVINGIWWVGVLNNANINSVISGSKGFTQSLQYQANFVPRWSAGTDGAAESGSNAGTNYIIQSYNDGGTPAATPPFSINRATGAVTVSNNLTLNGQGIKYGGAHAIAFSWSGTQLLLNVDGIGEGEVMTSIFSPLPANAANDAAAATAGVGIGGVYRNGSVMMVRVT